MYQRNRKLRLSLGATALSLTLLGAASDAAPQPPPTKGSTQSTTEEPGQGTSDAKTKRTAAKHLAGVELALVLVVLLGLPMLAHSRKNGEPNEIRGLGLPRGSVRGMLALLIVGSTINFLLFGSEVVGESFGEVVGVLSTLSASVLGFYFGGRTAAPSPGANQKGKAPDSPGSPGEPKEGRERKEEAPNGTSRSDQPEEGGEREEAGT